MSAPISHVSSYKVLICGAGQIGAFYDQPDSNQVLTHAHAFSTTPGFELAGFVDPDANQGQKAAERWKTEHFPSLEAAIEETHFDIACVCVPDYLHAALLSELVGLPLKLVFAEKPFTRSAVEAEAIAMQFAERQIPLLINYTRRFVPEFLNLAQAIREEKYGRFLGGNGYYGKGFIHNGSHMINLLLMLFDTVEAGQALGAITDYVPEDPSLNVTLRLNKQADFVMHAIDCRHVTIFEIELLFEKRRVSIQEGGFKLAISDVVDNPVFTGYRNYGPLLFQETGISRALAFAAQNIKAHLTSGAPLLSGPEAAIQTLRLCQELRDQSSEITQNSVIRP